MNLKNDPELRLWFYLAEKRGLTVRELRDKMSENEFKYWLGLRCLGVIGYEAEFMKLARIERRIACSMSSNANKGLLDYFNDPFALSDEEDEDFQDYKEKEEKSLAERAAAGEFDAEKMREFARKNEEEKKKRLKNGDNT